MGNIHRLNFRLCRSRGNGWLRGLFNHGLNVHRQLLRWLGTNLYRLSLDDITRLFTTF
jgi:hypothetical protein